MRNIILKALGGIALVLCLSVMLTSANVAEQGGGGRLEGAWNVRVTIRNCQTGAEIRSFDSVTTFAFGGTVFDSTSGTPQAQRTIGQGVWSHVSGDTYRLSFKTFNFDPAGNYVNWTKITHEAHIESSGDSYSSAGAAEVFAPNGTLLATGCSTTTATRFE